MSEKISSELDYSPVVSNHSTVLFRSVAPQGSNSVTSSITSSVGPTEFIIPPSCFRLDKSRLNFTLTLASPGGTFSNVINANTLTAISRITLYDSATNALWCDISNVNQYASLVVPACTDFKHYSTKSFNSTTPVTDTDANIALATTASRLVTVEDISKSNLAAGAANNLAGDGTVMSNQNPFFSRRQFYFGATTDQANALDVSIPLSAFKLSVLSSDKLMYCPSNLVLQVYWAPNNNYAFKATTVGTNPANNDASLTTAVAISNISLTLANEGNLAIVSQVINKVMTSGISLPIAYPTVTTFSSSDNATAHSYQLSLTRGYGNRILALLTAPFTRSTVSENNVHKRGGLTQYNTFLNNVAIKSQAGFSIASSADFIVANREYLEDSVIQSLGEYIAGEWVHIDSFFGEKPIKDVNQHEVDGLDVGAQSSTWQIQATSTASSYNWCSIIIGQKQLSVSNQGSMVQ
jgi:hypothetical protein